MTVWLVAQVKSADGRIFEIGGIFKSRKKAEAHCFDEWDAVMPLKLNEFLGREKSEEVGYYPLAGLAGTKINHERSRERR